MIEFLKRLLRVYSTRQHNYWLADHPNAEYQGVYESDDGQKFFGFRDHDDRAVFVADDIGNVQHVDVSAE